MKTIVIYNSQTGFTKRYAEWIAAAAGADCLPLAEAKKKDMSAYEAIVFGGWACAGSISKLGWFKDNIERWSDKKLIVFCVGASSMESPEIAKALEQHFNEPKLEQTSVFYCPGGLAYEKMSASSRLMMKMFVKMLKAKKNKTKDDEEQIRWLSSSYDISDQKYIEPILACLRG